MKATIKVGDILAGKWRYTMEFPVWFKVIKVTAKQAQAVELCSRMVQSTDGYGQQGYEVPDLNRVMDSRVHTIRLGKRGLETGSWSSYNHYYLEVWDGSAKYADYCD